MKFYLFPGRVGDELAVEVADADGADGAAPGDVGGGEGGRGGVDGHLIIILILNILNYHYYMMATVSADDTEEASTERRLQTSCVSRPKPLGKSGRTERSTILKGKKM